MPDSVKKQAEAMPLSSAKTIILKNPEDTAELARVLAQCLTDQPFSILMKGSLGSGKTTLTRDLVASLPGGSDAEVSSPSFTVCNFYPTEPRLLHCDLYRLGAGSRLPDEACEELDEGDAVLVAEWADYLHPDDVPDDRLSIFFDFLPENGQNIRALSLAAHGPGAERALENISRRLAPTA